MSSFIKPPAQPSKSKAAKIMTAAKRRSRIQTRGSQSDDRIRDVLTRIDMEKQQSMGMPSQAGPSGSTNVLAPTRSACPNPRCPDPSAPVTDGYCSACGREIDTSNIVAEVQFGETSTGAAIVQGQFVGADQGTTRNMGPAFRRIGGFGDSRERTIREARQMMQSYAQQLKVNENTVNVGLQIFKLALSFNWVQGRGMIKVVPICLYAACRREEKCRVMLIDFADLVKINVYELGHVFKSLSDIYDFPKNSVRSIVPEDLMYRFADKLDFGEFTNNVAEDATRLCKRMGLDWMVMGRRPSGICGACILMAARMWNFRRTVREVVYVVKVTTHTLEQRLGEFRELESGEMTIEDFLHQELLESRHDPPSFYKKSAEWKEKLRQMESEKEANGLKRKRRVLEDIEGGPDTESPGGGAGSSQQPGSTSNQGMPPPPPPDLSRIRPVTDFLTRSDFEREGDRIIEPFDHEKPPAPAPRIKDRDVETALDGFEDPTGEEAVERLAGIYADGTEVEGQPEAPAATTATLTPGGRKRGKKGQPQEPVLDFNEEWERDEAILEQQIEEVIADPHSDQHRKALATAAHHARVKAEWARSLLPSRGPLRMDEIIGEDEFADDPEVQHCQLTEEEMKIKERIWLNANKDWLRKRQEKEYKEQMEKFGPPKQRRNRLKKPRIGEGQLTPASTPGEAAREAMKKRGFSRRINYEAIENLFADYKPHRGPGSVVGSLLESEGRAESIVDGSEAGYLEEDDEEAPKPRTTPRPAAKPAAKPAEPEEEAQEEEEEEEEGDYEEQPEEQFYDEGEEEW